MRTLLIVTSILYAWGIGAPARAQILQVGASTSESTEQASQTWQILDYLADDYRGAVTDGKITSASEYAEMREFAEAVRTHLRTLPTVPTSSTLQAVGEERRMGESFQDVG